MSAALSYYEWLFFKTKSITKWAEANDIDMGTQSIHDFFNVCLTLAGKDIDDDKRECFIKNMWKKGKKRLAVGLYVQIEGIMPYTTDHMIEFLSPDNFIDENGRHIPYYQIRRIVTIPEKSKYSNKNIKVGMRLRLENKNVTGNVYTVVAVHRKGFDAKNGKYSFKNLEYSSIAEILK